jgi:uncharacterized C2H2 Zn-finger protein
MPEEIDHDGTDHIVCPHCGHIDRNSWECGLGDGDEEASDCGQCDKSFTVRASIYRTFSTRIDEPK